MFKIESGVPIPDAPRNRKLYPWAEMKVGDSFFAPGVKMTSMSNPRYTAELRHKIKTTARTEGNGVRVWRIE